VNASWNQVWVVSIPLAVPFRGITQREALIFQGERAAEWSPFIEYSDQEAASWLKAALSWANDPLPTPKRDRVGINATLPAVLPSEVQGVLARFGGFETVKIKIAQRGQDMAADVARVNEVSRLYPKVKIRLDANGGYTVTEILRLLEQLDVNLEYLEQPVATIAEMAELRQQLAGSGIRICADELVRKGGDPAAIEEAGAADILMLKAQPLGGIQAALEIARASKLEVVVSSALETSLGIAQGVYLAAALENLNYDCGLGTLNLLEGDVVIEPLSPQDGFLTPTVPQLDQALLEKYAADAERRDWWLSRLERCLELQS
jgi:o-succinylbenzoate synthase